MPEGSGGITAKILAMTEKGEPVKFNMGSGQDKLEGYIGVDKYDNSADIKQDFFELSLPPECADEILASHVIEHIPYVKILGLLKTWLDTLKPGGKLVLELPNLEELCKDFVNATPEERLVLTLCIYGAYAGEVTKQTISTGTTSPHLWGYYPKILVYTLEEVGFKDIQVLPAQGAHPGKNFRVEANK
jgi:SAM-dependent methyltransferase